MILMVEIVLLHCANWENVQRNSLSVIQTMKRNVRKKKKKCSKWYHNLLYIESFIWYAFNSIQTVSFHLIHFECFKCDVDFSLLRPQIYAEPSIESNDVYELYRNAPWNRLNIVKIASRKQQNSQCQST